ncbi:DUF5343 domain-containing protein [Brevundimonas sp.]|uniref:DUF5343 domain-containing protein n=1 Tax=Brevundimonas sp. TaxID=1871086 RepID=UPI002D242FDD|nr:DUF5343 domain-containing protein [Brevundimonas sp.]HYC98768.1 DUF5343 domain-containing protein [Brevundimonas sp.]
MPVTPDRAGPYAPAKVIIDLIERYRSKGLPTPVNGEVLGRAGVPDSLIARTLQALTVLDLIDPEGRPTPALDEMQKASEADYRTRMGEWLAAAYADALQFVDPASASETEVRDAFRQYKPVGQQRRMVILFMGLFRHAGIAPGRTPTGGAAPRKKVSDAGAKPRMEKRHVAPPKPKDDFGADEKRGEAGTGNLQGDQKQQTEFMKALLDKFPAFDPAWPDDIKAKWFEGFDIFMKGASLK